MGFQVAIDGPVGVGKSTVSRLVAERAGFLYIDTGAMYRAVALLALRSGVSLGDGEAVAALLPRAGLSLEHDTVLLNGDDVTRDIRTNKVSLAASAVAVHKAVRMFLVTCQRELAGLRNVVMDGRDIGTRVLPQAQLKIYLDAPDAVRARRRFLELEAKGSPVELETVANELAARDYNDLNRAEDPLCKAGDAVVIDASLSDAAGVADAILALIKERGGL